MNVALNDRILDTMQKKTTDELLEIWQSNDRAQWSDSAFSAISQVLFERGVSVPTQGSIKVTHAFPYKGVRGWLLWLCIVLTFLGPASLLNDALTAFRLTSEPSFGHFATILQAEAVIEIALAAMSVYAGICLWMVLPGATAKAKIYLWTRIVYTPLSMLGLRVLGLRIPLVHLIGTSLAALIAGMIWLWYLESSKRVKATYNLR